MGRAGHARARTGRYPNTPATELFLDRTKPSYLGAILELGNARYRTWGSLTESLRTGRPHNERKDGADYFKVLYTDPLPEVDVLVMGHFLHG